MTASFRTSSVFLPDPQILFVFTILKFFFNFLLLSCFSVSHKFKRHGTEAFQRQCCGSSREERWKESREQCDAEGFLGGSISDRFERSQAIELNPELVTPVQHRYGLQRT